jgi:hypothetical protein
MKVAQYIESLERARTPDCGAACDETEAAERGREASPPDEVAFEPVEGCGVMGLVELVLKDRRRLHLLIRDPALQSELVTRLLAIACVGFAFFGVAMTVVLSSAGVWPKLTAIETWLNEPGRPLIAFFSIESAAGLAAPWLDGSALKLIAAYTLGIVAASGVCLPALYFYALLAGVRMTMLDCVIHSLKAKATAAVALVGLLPIYAALAMGMVVFRAPEPLVTATLWIGLVVPFIAGFWGTHSLYVGFAGFCDTLPPERQERRECFLRRLVLSWSAVFTAVTPVMIFTLWELFGT